MDNIPEITRKEKSLADLMTRVLKEPLNPLQSSVNKVESDVLGLMDKVNEVEQRLEVSAVDIDKLGKTLKKIIQEELPSLTQKIQENVEDCFSKEIKNLTDRIDERAKYLTEQIDLHNNKFAEISGAQEDIKALFENLRKSIVAQNVSIIDVVTRNLSDAIQVNSEQSADLIIGLSNKASSQYEQMVHRLDDISVKNQDDANNFLVTLNRVVDNQNSISEKISIENSAFTSAIAASGRNMNRILATLLVLACVVVTYIGYDIFFSK